MAGMYPGRLRNRTPFISKRRSDLTKQFVEDAIIKIIEPGSPRFDPVRGLKCLVIEDEDHGKLIPVPEKSFGTRWIPGSLR